MVNRVQGDDYTYKFELYTWMCALSPVWDHDKMCIVANRSRVIWFVLCFSKIEMCWYIRLCCKYPKWCRVNGVKGAWETMHWMWMSVTTLCIFKWEIEIETHVLQNTRSEKSVCCMCDIELMWLLMLIEFQSACVLWLVATSVCRKISKSTIVALKLPWVSVDLIHPFIRTLSSYFVFVCVYLVMMVRVQRIVSMKRQKNIWAVEKMKQKK